MIDDDFDKLVRNMFERFFGKAFRMNPEDSKVRIEIEGSGITSSPINTDSEAFVDIIEYENEIMVIIETTDRIEQPEANITQGLLSVRINPESSRIIRAKIPGTIDLQRSEMSCNNGVIEVRMVKANGVQKEGTISVTN
ncbi:MAG: hypothetical protein ACFFED_11310 [Candidatus Thorarchaeota archaeon]